MNTRGLSTLCYILVVLITTCIVCLSCILLLTQAVRTSHSRNFVGNWNVVIIGVSYSIVLFACLALCIRRRISIHRKLQRISKHHKALGKGDVPDRVHTYITQEYARACLIAYEALPKDGFQEGWGVPGTMYEGVNYRKALLETIPVIDKLAHEVIPRHPDLRHHTRLIQHFRFLLPLLPKDEVCLTPLHYYDSGIQLARLCNREPTKEEFLRCLAAAEEIRKLLQDYLVEMQMEEDEPRATNSPLEGSSSVHL